MIFKRILIFAILGFVTLSLTGCFGGGSSNDSQEATTITFDTFSLTIPETYTEVPSTLTENKQILNKVVKSFKLIDDEGYEDNIMITKSLIAPQITSEQFAAANHAKIADQIIGFTPGTQSVGSIPCGESQYIDTYRHVFTVTENFYQKAAQYTIEQLQFVYDKKGYIIAIASDQETKKVTKAFTKILKTLTCSPLSPTTSDE